MKIQIISCVNSNSHYNQNKSLKKNISSKACAVAFGNRIPSAENGKTFFNAGKKIFKALRNIGKSELPESPISVVAPVSQTDGNKIINSLKGKRGLDYHTKSAMDRGNINSSDVPYFDKDIEKQANLSPTFNQKKADLERRLGTSDKHKNDNNPNFKGEHGMNDVDGQGVDGDTMPVYGDNGEFPASFDDIPTVEVASGFDGDILDIAGSGGDLPTAVEHGAKVFDVFTHHTNNTGGAVTKSFLNGADAPPDTPDVPDVPDVPDATEVAHSVLGHIWDVIVDFFN